MSVAILFIGAELQAADPLETRIQKLESQVSQMQQTLEKFSGKLNELPDQGCSKITKIDGYVGDAFILTRDEFYSEWREGEFRLQDTEGQTYQEFKDTTINLKRTSKNDSQQMKKGSVLLVQLNRPDCKIIPIYGPHFIRYKN